MRRRTIRTTKSHHDMWRDQRTEFQDQRPYVPQMVGRRISRRGTFDLIGRSSAPGMLLTTLRFSDLSKSLPSYGFDVFENEAHVLVVVDLTLLIRGERPQSSLGGQFVHPHSEGLLPLVSALTIS